MEACHAPPACQEGEDASAAQKGAHVLWDIDFDREPHLGQGNYMNGGVFHMYELDQLERTLHEDAPQRPYRKIPHHERTVNHWGQRKLLLSEIEFLTVHGSPGCIVVYAGAAPGTHIPYLVKLFPEVRAFILYDPADFKVESTERIEVRQEFFTDAVVEELKKRFPEDEPVLFISDIRTADPNVMSQEEVEDSVARDMEMQMEWVRRLQPKASMLKFRLPWGEGQSRYLKGDIYLPVWGPQTTTETRLVVTDIDLVEYDNRKYWEQMFYFNTVTRVSYYKHDVEVPGLDHCYDCAAEVVLLKRYWDKRNVIGTATESMHARTEAEDRRSSLSRSEMELIAKMADEISREISPHSHRTLASRLDVITRKTWFRGRKFDVAGKTVIDLGPVEPPADVDTEESVATLRPRSIGAVASDKRTRDEEEEEEPRTHRCKKRKRKRARHERGANEECYRAERDDENLTERTRPPFEKTHESDQDKESSF